MNESDPDEVKFLWFAEIDDNPLDLTEAVETVAASMPSIRSELQREKFEPHPIPEETLTEVYSRDGYLMAYAEVFHGENGDTMRLYKAEHPPGAPRVVLPPDIDDAFDDDR
ncbi:hypothetical protein [Glycomyces lechevalierae]|uniref:Uncharacterized protein n=1 Tax=Glycomyces lechevalierae TaxID=256034 RepID=A0ABU2AHX9_9ACTN|nr:hypothetical protein [Glycomyces lechevalierae]MDR7336817.1 hypothetical protein [Glycomyces lechevalierae]